MSPLWGSRTWKPRARTAELLVEELGDELMVYDQRDDQVHCLGPTARSVWHACDGKTSVEQLGRALSLEHGVVDRALGELEACGLLDGEATDGVTRREAGVRLAKMGAAAASAPLIYSIAAPAPALAVSPLFCQSLGTAGCAGAIVNGAKSCSVAPCNMCRSSGCACCWLSPMQCTGSVNYYRCTTSCAGANNHCSRQYIGAAGGPCAPVLAQCNNYNACNNC